MSRLEELIQELCPDGVEYKKLNDASIISRGIRVVRSQLKEEGQFPVFQNSLTPMGYHDRSNCPANTTFVIAAGAAGDVGYSRTEFWAADDCFYFTCPETLLSRYLYYVLMSQQTYLYSKVRKASIPRLARNFIEDLQIPVPPLPVQAEIIRTLGNFTERTAELAEQLLAELNARKKQYEYYRDKLLTFGTAIEWKKLGELFPHIRNGFVGTVTPYFTDKEHGIRYLEGRHIHNGFISNDDALYVTTEFHKKHMNSELKTGDILMVQSGHVGESAVVGEEFSGANCHALIIMSNGGACNSKFINYYFQSSEGKKKLDKISTGGTVKHILASGIKNYMVPIPPLPVQQRIVNILDNFDAICTDLNIGLPAEIEARQKQYEYYRDLLLSFDDCSQLVHVERERERERERDRSAGT